jgi:hypothetical protein
MPNLVLRTNVERALMQPSNRLVNDARRRRLALRQGDDPTERIGHECVLLISKHRFELSRPRCLPPLPGNEDCRDKFARMPDPFHPNVTGDRLEPHEWRVADSDDCWPELPPESDGIRSGGSKRRGRM